MKGRQPGRGWHYGVRAESEMRRRGEPRKVEMIRLCWAVSVTIVITFVVFFSHRLWWEVCQECQWRSSWWWWALAVLPGATGSVFFAWRDWWHARTRGALICDERKERKARRG